ncbi:Fur family transcriptional regulator [Desulfoscipio sp. XC116]|uniref:Fur family transcriptional regulator n=1 Tax=Desulfoscipio sp. XC116 TaxID=3144975 RepID=UPI00325ABC66
MNNELEILSLKEKFHRFGYKYTDQRQLVLDVLSEHPDLHLSSDDICEYLKQKKIKMGQSTVYRTLLILEKMKIVRKMDLNDGFTRYELCDHEEEHAHHHLICSKCGSVTDIKGDLLNNLEQQIYRSYGFKINDHILKFFGECRNCLDKNS